jgi:hypothetical protein
MNVVEKPSVPVSEEKIKTTPSLKIRIALSGIALGSGLSVIGYGVSQMVDSYDNNSAVNAVSACLDALPIDRLSYDESIERIDACQRQGQSAQFALDHEYPDGITEVIGGIGLIIATSFAMPTIEERIKQTA